MKGRRSRLATGLLLATAGVSALSSASAQPVYRHGGDYAVPANPTFRAGLYQTLRNDFLSRANPPPGVNPVELSANLAPFCDMSASLRAAYEHSPTTDFIGHEVLANYVRQCALSVFVSADSGRLRFVAVYARRSDGATGACAESGYDDADLSIVCADAAAVRDPDQVRQLALSQLARIGKRP